MQPNLMAEREKYGMMLTKMVAEASRKKEFIQGVSLGKTPKYFIVGDEPVDHDYLTKIPFSGPLGDVLVSAITTLKGKYPEAKRDDCHVTYFVKTTFREGELTEKMVIEEWLPALQLEYYLSGCELVVTLGRMARQFAGRIAVRPPFLTPYKPSFSEKLARMWAVVRS